MLRCAQAAAASVSQLCRGGRRSPSSFGIQLATLYFVIAELSRRSN